MSLVQMQPKNSILCACEYTSSSIIYHRRFSAVSEPEYDGFLDFIGPFSLLEYVCQASCIPVTVHVYLEPRHTEVQAVLSVG